MTGYLVSHEDMERHRSAHEVARHEVKQFMLGLDDDGLRMLEMMMDTITNSQSPQVIASYFSGQISALRQQKFDICFACGKNHDADLANMSAPEMPETPPHVEARRRVDEQAEATVDETKRTEIGSTDGLYDHEIRLMDQYNLDDLRDEDTHALIGFVCLRCGMRYPTIDSRMSREPQHTGCAGCIEKEKFG